MNNFHRLHLQPMGRFKSPRFGKPPLKQLALLTGVCASMFYSWAIGPGMFLPFRITLAVLCTIYMIILICLTLLIVVLLGEKVMRVALSSPARSLAFIAANFAIGFSISVLIKNFMLTQLAAYGQLNSFTWNVTVIFQALCLTLIPYAWINGGNGPEAT